MEESREVSNTKKCRVSAAELISKNSSAYQSAVFAKALKKEFSYTRNFDDEEVEYPIDVGL